MLSKKLTFSLASLVVLFAFAFVFVPVTLAANIGDKIEDTKITGPLPVLSVIDELDEVAKKADRKDQVTLYGANTATQPTAVSAVDTQAKIRNIVFPNGSVGEGLELYLRLHAGYAVLKRSDGAPVGADDAPGTADAYFLHPRDLTVKYLNRDGVDITPATTPIDDAGTTIEPRNSTFPDGQNFTITIATGDIPDNTRYMTVSIGAGAFNNVDPRATFRTIGPASMASTPPDPGDPFKVQVKDKKVVHGGLQLFLINEDAEKPNVVSMVRTVTATSGRSDAATSQFGGDPVSGPFNVKVTFTEEPKFTFNNADDPTQGYKLDALPFRVDNGKITAIAKGTPFYVKPDYREGDYTAAGNVPDTTGSDLAYHPYLLTIAPTLANGNDVMIYLQGFSDLVIPGMMYQAPNNASRVNTRSMLRVPVLATAVAKGHQFTDAEKKAAGNEKYVPGKLVIPRKWVSRPRSWKSGGSRNTRFTCENC